MPPRATRRSPLTANDLLRLRVATGVALSPDEDRIAYVIERMDQEEKRKYYSNIEVYDIDLGRSITYTHGDHSDATPTWSHDSGLLAFVSNRNKKTGIYIIPADGGSERRLIELDASIASLQFTPDDRELVFAMRYNDSHAEADEKKKKDAPLYRHIDRLFYRLDGSGFNPKDRFDIYAVDIDSGQLRQVTRSSRDNHSPHVSPDGKLVVYVSNRAQNEDVNQSHDDLFVTPLAGGKERKLATPLGPKTSPRFSPNGKSVAWIGHDNTDDGWGITNHHVWTVGLNGRPKATDLMPGFDRWAVDLTIGDLSDVHDSATLFWSDDGKRIYFLASDTGNTNAYYVPSKGGKPTRVFRGDVHIQAMAMNGATKRIAYALSDLNTPSKVAYAPAKYEGEKSAQAIGDFNPWVKSEKVLGKTKEVMFESFDGTQVQGFVITPPGFKKTRKYPAVLMIHGGPRVQYGYSFFHEFQYLAAMGYVVFYTNPRGGQGRGETWAAAIHGGWGELDYKDCMAAADWMEKQPYINSKKIGVAGGSYGGFMTNWIVGHTHRFAAAITMRCVYDLDTFVGTSDIGWELRREFDGLPWTNPENYAKCSPKTYVGNIKTPLMIFHSENDLRCAIEQSEQLFVRLKLDGKKVEMVRFPEESHGLSRHGRPDRRIARLEWIDRWFAKFLK